MAKFTPYALNALPTNGIDTNGIYFIKASGNRFHLYMRNKDNSDWVHLGVTNAVDKVNNLTGDVKIDLNFTGGKLKITATGDGTQSSVATIDLDARYRRLGVQIPWSEISGAPNFAIDSEVVHKTGSETIAGVKTFTSKPKVPAATASSEAVNKGQLDDAVQNLQSLIDQLDIAVGSSLSYKGDIDASSNPNFPAADTGHTYIISKKGKIGGSNGIQVDVGNTIIAKQSVSEGTYGSVGDKWTVLQADLDEASETVAGFIKIATQAVADAGVDDKTAITPKKLDVILTAFENHFDGKYLRFDETQSLSTAEKNRARQNIEAAKDSEVVHKTGSETISGKKTFTALPETALDPTANNQLARKKYVDETIAANVKWGGNDGKEW